MTYVLVTREFQGDRPSIKFYVFIITQQYSLNTYVMLIKYTIIIKHKISKDLSTVSSSGVRWLAGW